jgi:hypothetical protein
LPRPPAASARRRERWRVAKATCRERARRGERCGRFRYDAVVLDFLIANRWLAECGADNAKAIGDAVTRLLAASARLQIQKHQSSVKSVIPVSGRVRAREGYW